jgi:signal transduction histidine kinase
MSDPAFSPFVTPAPALAWPVLVADDDCAVCRLIEDTLVDAGYSVVCLHSGAEIVDWLSHRRARLLLLDVRLPDMDGSSVLDELSRLKPAPPYVIVSGLCDTKVAVEFMRRGARDYLIKDANFLDLVPAVVQRVLHDSDRDDQIARLQHDMLEISEREQRRIGQDIHDDLCQRLAAIKMKLQHLAEEVEKAAPELAEEAAALSYHLGDATRVARALARGLSPVDIGHEGLPAALHGLARAAEEIFQIKCRLHVEESCPPLDHHAATQLYRIAQECISNAVKHAAATRIGIDFRCTGDPIVMTVTNDGYPFPSRPGHTGLGLQLMRQRAESTGARLEFIHQPADGATAVRVTLPHHEKRKQVAF